MHKVRILPEKKKVLAKLVEFKETFDLCDIRRVRNTKFNLFTFTQKYFLVLFNVDLIIYSF